MHDEDTKDCTTFACATREYDPEFERTIAAAVSTAIARIRSSPMPTRWC